MTTVRNPASAPFARTSGVTGSTALPFTSCLSVAPSALLLWKPVPAFP